MTADGVELILHRLGEIENRLESIEAEVKMTNGRVKEQELWRARMQGGASVGKWAWLISGAAITALVIEVIRASIN